jgi:hypothetical protein
MVNQLQQSYEVIQALADEQDRRLETDWYGERVRRRWNQFKLLAQR